MKIIEDIKKSEIIQNKNELITALNNIIKTKKSPFQKGKVDKLIRLLTEVTQKIQKDPEYRNSGEIVNPLKGRRMLLVAGTTEYAPLETFIKTL